MPLYQTRPLKQRVSVTLDEDVIETVKILAEDNDRSFSQYINLLLKRHIDEEKDNLETRHPAGANPDRCARPG